MEKIPVIIVTGFLGTGKTTLIKRICTEMVSKRVGVIQNEFSEVMGVEKPILAKSGATVYELPNGCLCCSAKSEMVTALESFVELSDRIDLILVESSGTSDPITLTGNLWLDQNLESRLKLEGVVSITDVNTLNLFLRYDNNSNFNKNNMYNINDDKTNVSENQDFKSNFNIDVDTNPNTNTNDIMNPSNFNNNNNNNNNQKDYSELFDIFSKQLSVADLLVVNKTDINALTDELRNYLLSINNCNVVESVKCNFDLKYLFELGVFETKKLLSLDLRSLPESKHRHNKLKSVCVKNSNTYSLKYVNDTIAYLLWERNDIYRCKGIFRAKRDCSVTCTIVDGSVCSFELQGVGQLYEINPVDVDHVDNVFLFIGNDLDSDLLNNLLSKTE